MLAAFERLMSNLYDWLNCHDPVCKSDVVFALSGRRKRMLFAMELFSHGCTKSVLLSVGPYEIGWGLSNLPWPMPFEIPESALSLRSTKDRLFIGYEAGVIALNEVEIGRFGTLSEIRALARWLQCRPQVGSLLVVSSAPHLRRIRVCCGALLPPGIHVRFLFVPGENPFLDRNRWWKNSRTRTAVISEIPKLLVYSTILRTKKESA
jgi:hypothetical protein